jgi:hypothetical protein
MIINVGDSLRRWWPALIPAIVATYNSVAPQIQTWVSVHPKAAIYVSAATVFIATLFKSPLLPTNGASSSSLADAIAKAKKGA